MNTTINTITTCDFLKEVSQDEYMDIFYELQERQLEQLINLIMETHDFEVKEKAFVQWFDKKIYKLKNLYKNQSDHQFFSIS